MGTFKHFWFSTYYISRHKKLKQEFYKIAFSLLTCVVKRENTIFYILPYLCVCAYCLLPIILILSLTNEL